MNTAMDTVSMSNETTSLVEEALARGRRLQEELRRKQSEVEAAVEQFKRDGEALVLELIEQRDQLLGKVAEIESAIYDLAPEYRVRLQAPNGGNIASPQRSIILDALARHPHGYSMTDLVSQVKRIDPNAVYARLEQIVRRMARGRSPEVVAIGSGHDRVWRLVQHRNLPGDAPAAIEQPAAAKPRTKRVVAKQVKKTGEKHSRRNTKQLSTTMRKVVAFLSKHPGSTVERIAMGTDIETSVLALPIKKLIAAKKVSKTGLRRGTKYSLRKSR